MSENEPLPPEPETRSQTERSPTSSKRLQSGFKAGTIKALRGAIAFLEGLVSKLEAEPSSPTEPERGVSRLGFLGRIRSALPETLEQKLPDWGLIGAIVVLILLASWTAYALLPGKPAEVAEVEPREPTEVVEVEPPQTPGPIEPPLEAPQLPDRGKSEPELEAPSIPAPLETAPALEPEFIPAVTPELTPEQILIAAIENQVADVTRDYADLIQGINANFSASLLRIKLSDEWYELLPARQDKIATQMLKESRKLDFRRLEITNSQGLQIARSPVVGSSSAMIILQRSRS